MKEKINSKKEKPKKKKEIKKEIPKIEEKSELVKDIVKNEEEIDNEEFEEFFEVPSFRTASPSLGKINSDLGREISLEGDLTEESEFNKKESNDSFKYDIGNITGGESKYQQYKEDAVSANFQRTEIENIGKTDTFERREVGFMASSESRAGESAEMERYNPVRRLEKEKLGRENFLEEKEIKYKPLR